MRTSLFIPQLYNTKIVQSMDKLQTTKIAKHFLAFGFELYKG